MSKSSKTTYIKSKKFQNISYRTTNTDTIYYYSMKKEKHYSRFKACVKSLGGSEAKAYEIMQQEKLKLLGIHTEITQTKSSNINIEDAGNMYFHHLELTKPKSDFRNSHNKFRNHLLIYFKKDTKMCDITSTQIHEYKNFKMKSLAPATVAMHISILSSCYNFLRKVKDIDIKNSARGIESTIILNNEREKYLSTEEINLLNHTLSSNKYGKNEHMAWLLEHLVLFALSTGARISSLLEIKRSQISKQNRTCKIFDSKNGTWYTTYLSSKLLPNLDFLDNFKMHHYIFYNNRQLTHRIVAYHLRPIFNDLFNQGLAKDDCKNRVVFHTLRKTCFSHLAINKVPLYTLRELSNHKSLAILFRYISLSEEAKVSAIEGLY